MSQTELQPQWITILRLCERLWTDENWTEEDMAIINRHFRYLQDLTEAGTMIVVGRTDVAMKDNLGIAVFQAENERVARRIMNADPVVQLGVMTAELFPFRVALLQKNLFSSSTNAG